MALQDIADRLIADLIPQIGQGPHDAVIAPIRVLLSHADDLATLATKFPCIKHVFHLVKGQAVVLNHLRYIDISA